MKKSVTKYYDLSIPTFLKIMMLVSIPMVLVVLYLCFSIIISKDVEVLGKILAFIPITFILSILFSMFINQITARVKSKKINKDLNDNSLLYCRELPNHFGIGVATLLINSAIENYKDIVAVILDLCARKYLFLEKQDDKYIIKVLKDVDDNLLDNEKYIMSLLLNNDLSNINYRTWFEYCMNDGIKLGLYQFNDIKIDENYQLNQIEKYKLNTNQFKFILIISIALAIIFAPLFILFILIPIFYLVIAWLRALVGGIKTIHYSNKQVTYKYIMNSELKITEKGFEELHKLDSFKNFIKDFGAFASRNIDEIYIWDRYLSYAQLFGLTENIMNSGYKQLVENSSFIIDDIGKIKLEDIKLG